ncbi:ABC transporter substrate-binding protein [uncultured Tessaracoccus sp.]|uniref:ABC transporter substrate-binding protein n=1 Tax=uncultured Tessaracoccus sp. TaxID=905023 RepID=UPI00262A9FB8|nr:ABC transporter substrate-binding protein [uncultured Tessaracoccus sp.]
MTKRLLVPLALLSLAVAACGTSAADKANQAASQASEPSASTSQASEPSAATGFPARITNCGHELTVEKAPERVLMFSGTAAPVLDELGLLDKVTAHAGAQRFGEAAGDLDQKLRAIKQVSSEELETGGASMSTEAILAVNPDLVLAYDQGVDREALAKLGIPFYSPEALCPNYEVKQASWELVDEEFERIATIFGVTDRLPQALERLHSQVNELQQHSDAVAGSTGAALYVTPGSSTFYAYGTSSMVQPIFSAVGLKNSFDDETTRVFDMTMETLLKRDPEWIVLLSQDATEQEAKDTFMGFPGVDALQAVTKNQVVVLPFALTDPPSNLSVEGAVRLAKALHQ